MVDANQVWDVDEAIEWMRHLAPFDLRWIEEPTSPDDVLGHAAIRRAVAPVGVATGEHCANRVIFKQLLQAGAIDYCQIDACRLGGLNEVLAVLLLAAKFGVPVCPHAGGLGLCEYVQHLSLIDYIARRGQLRRPRTEFADHLHEHFVDPVRGARWPLPGARRDPATRSRCGRSRSPRSPSRTARSGGVPDPAERVALGRSALRVTRLGLGGAPLGNMYSTVGDAQAQATIDAAWAAGVRWFDTAPLYGHGLSEQRFGRALRGRPRDDHVLATKVGRRLVPGTDPDTIFAAVPALRPLFDFSYDGVLRGFDESLARLQLDRVDVVHVHDPDEHEARGHRRRLSRAAPTARARRDRGGRGGNEPVGDAHPLRATGTGRLRAGGGTLLDSRPVGARRSAARPRRPPASP